MLISDMWYEDREPDFSKDVLGNVYHDDRAGRYRANIFDREGRCVGDIVCSDSVELEHWVSRHGGKIDWGA
jgi:hypothetical protein